MAAQPAPVAALVVPLSHPGGLENGLVVSRAGDLALADLVPLQELGLHVAVGVDLPRVDQVGDEQVLLLVGHGVTPLRSCAPIDDTGPQGMSAYTQPDNTINSFLA